MSTKAECERAARGLMAHHGLTGWVFRWSRSRVNFGLCRYPWKGKPGVIELSLPAARVNGFSVRWAAGEVLHEIAHATLPPPPAGTDPHHAKWAERNAELGGCPQGHGPTDRLLPIWLAECCGQSRRRATRPPPGASCRRCKAPLAFRQGVPHA
jgi:hypothetical protein